MSTGSQNAIHFKHDGRDIASDVKEKEKEKKQMFRSSSSLTKVEETWIFVYSKQSQPIDTMNCACYNTSILKLHLVPGIRI